MSTIILLLYSDCYIFSLIPYRILLLLPLMIQSHLDCERFSLFFSHAAPNCGQTVPGIILCNDRKRERLLLYCF